MNYRRLLKCDHVIEGYIEAYLKENQAARLLQNALAELGIGLRPLVDHITIRTLNVDERAREFLELGFMEDLNLGIIEHDNWWAKVYRFPGQPAIFIDQAFDGERGKGCVIPGWVQKFGDNTLHHIAVNVDRIEPAIQKLSKMGVTFGGEITGEKDTALRQIFTKPELRDGVPYTVLELAERRWGYQGFVSRQANTLMESTRAES